MKYYDAIIIGSGQGGTPLSRKLAAAGRQTALVEKRWIGGTCVNDGCTPTKTMIASAKMAHLAAHSQKLGVIIPSWKLNLPAIVERKNEVVSMFRDGAQKGLEKTDNLELIFGEARFTGKKVLEIRKPGEEPFEITAENIFINTGTVTAIPDIEGLSGVPYLTSTSILDLVEVPEHLLVIGTGYIGFEFGQMFLRFGSKVTMLEASDQLLPKEDRDIADCLENILHTEGISFFKKAKVIKVSGAAGAITVTIEHANETLDIKCSHVLLATGRKAQTTELGVANTGVDVSNKQYIVVNEFLETTQPGIYALGDVKGGPAFTHISYNDHLLLFKNIIGGQKLSIKGRLLPYCMFTDPQLGRVGLSETEALRLGLNIQVATLSMENVARAIEVADTRGIMKAVVNRDTKEILGAAIIGTEGGEIMSVLQLAIVGGITYDRISEMMFAHPLYAESLNNIFMKLDN